MSPDELIPGATCTTDANNILEIVEILANDRIKVRRIGYVDSIGREQHMRNGEPISDIYSFDRYPFMLPSWKLRSPAGAASEPAGLPCRLMASSETDGRRVPLVVSAARLIAPICGQRSLQPA